MPDDIHTAMYFTKHNKLDKNYSERYTIKKNLAIENSEIIFHDDFEIKGIIFKGAPGLYELHFTKEPELKQIARQDLKSYKSILMATNAHRCFDADNEQIKVNRAMKYTIIIRKIFEDTHANVDGGLAELDMSDIEYVYWDDPNELVVRLRLLMSSALVGHNNNFNEAVAIIEALKRADIIE